MLQKSKRLSNRKALDEAADKPCWICRKPSDPCHIRTKKNHGPDVDWNLMILCRKHHVEQHKIGIVTFAKKYSIVMLMLRMNGWVIDNGKLWNDKLLGT